MSRYFHTESSYPKILVSCITIALLVLFLAISLSSAKAEPRYSLIRGALLIGGFRSNHDLLQMSAEDQRNTLIMELSSRTKSDVHFYQGLNDDDLGGVGTTFVYLRQTGARSDAGLKSMTADDMRNTLIVIANQQSHLSGPSLQGTRNAEILQVLMRPERSYIGGVLLVGQFRNFADLDRMSTEDQRNTLIVELTNRTANDVRFYQGLNDADLAGTGAILVYLRMAQIRSDVDLKRMSADDMRNTAIVVLHEQTRRSDLQALTNMQLALVALGTRQLPSLANVPDFLQPGEHTLSFPANHVTLQWSTRSFSDVPVIGTFIGRGTDCTHGFQLAQTATDASGKIVAVVGWGQVEGDGHPNSNSDQCVSWTGRLLVNFDISRFLNIQTAQFIRGVLSYQETEAPQCMTLVYTQGGFLADTLPCWTDGSGNRQGKPNGCLSLTFPTIDWLNHPPGNNLVGWHDLPVQKINPSSWDVTDVMKGREIPHFGDGPPIAPGFMLIGEIRSTGNLTADDNTRCTSELNNITLAVTYSLPPQQETFDPPVIK